MSIMTRFHPSFLDKLLQIIFLLIPSLPRYKSDIKPTHGTTVKFCPKIVR